MTNHMQVMQTAAAAKCGTCGDPANWWHFADSTWGHDECRCDAHLAEINYVVAGLLKFGAR